MAKHRDRIEIVADVLKAAGHGTRKTRIMWMANLSYKLLRKYLDEAVTLGYLTISQEEYGVTDDGDAFLKKYVEYSNRYSSMERELENRKLEKQVLKKMCASDRTLESRATEENQGFSVTDQIRRPASRSGSA